MGKENKADEGSEAFGALFIIVARLDLYTKSHDCERGAEGELRAQAHDGDVLLVSLSSPCWWWPRAWPPARARGARSPLAHVSPPSPWTLGLAVAKCSPNRAAYW